MKEEHNLCAHHEGQLSNECQGAECTWKRGVSSPVADDKLIAERAYEKISTLGLSCNFSVWSASSMTGTQRLPSRSERQTDPRTLQWRPSVLFTAV